MEATVSYLLMPQKDINSKQKTEIKYYTLYSANISNDFTVNNMKKKTGLKETVKHFFVDFSSTDTNDILEIHKYLMKKIYETMFGLV